MKRVLGILAFLVLVTGIYLLYVYRETLIKREQRIILYFSDKNGMYLVPVSRKLPPGIAPSPEIAIEELFKGPEDKENLLPVIPLPQIFSEVKRTKDELHISFKKDLLDEFGGGTFTETTLLSSLLFTSAQFPELKKIILLSDGQKLSLLESGHEILDELLIGNEKWINYNQEETDYAQIEGKPTRKVILYFLIKDTQYLVPLTREIPMEGEIIESLIKELIKGPHLNWVTQTPVPPKTELLSFSLQEGMAKVNFSHHLQEGLEEAINSIVFTLTELPEVKKVHILIEGKSIKITVRPKWINTEETFLTTERGKD